LRHLPEGVSTLWAPSCWWITPVRPARRPLCGLLRVSTLLDAISHGPHAEERLLGASRSTHGFDAALPPVPQSLQIPVIPEPADSVGNGLARRPRRVAELARRLFRAEIHLLSRHPNPVERDERLAPGNAGRQLRPDGDRKQHTVRDLEPGGAPADRLRHPGEDLSERHVLAPKNISLADPSVLGRGEMT